jgi:hypothetical protein
MMCYRNRGLFFLPRTVPSALSAVRYLQGALDSFAVAAAVRDVAGWLLVGGAGKNRDKRCYPTVLRGMRIC